MKTSKLILITFFSIIGLFLLSLMIQKKPSNWQEMRNEERIQLPAINHLKLHNIHSVKLCMGDSSRMNYWHLKTLQTNNSFFSVNSDTLVINRSPENIDENGLFVYLKNIKSVSVFNSDLSIGKFKISDLKTDLVHGNIYLQNIDSIQNLIIQLKEKSLFWCNPKIVNSIVMNLENSSANFNDAIIIDLNAELTDSSDFKVEKVLQSNVKTDETSNFHSR